VGRRIIAVAAEPIDAQVLRQAVGDREAEQAEVLVVAPALDSKVRFWMSDPDPGIERAEQVAEESAERMGEQGVDAVPDTGEPDPLQAIQDALVTFEADAIVLCTHPGGQENWREEGLVDKARERFPDQDVSHFEIERPA
jgi:nucleotide-binding universal stress UspA family protein